MSSYLVKHRDFILLTHINVLNEVYARGVRGGAKSSAFTVIQWLVRVAGSLNLNTCNYYCPNEQRDTVISEASQNTGAL
jgi:hypothetical protein